MSRKTVMSIECHESLHKNTCSLNFKIVAETVRSLPIHSKQVYTAGSTVRGVKTGYIERSRVHRHAMWNNAPIDLKIGPELDTLVLCDTYVPRGHMMKSSYHTVAKCTKFPILSEFQ